MSIKKSFQMAVLLTLLPLCMAVSNAHNAHASQPFDQWLNGVRSEARSKGISDNTLNEALQGVKPVARIIELDRQQIEGRMTFAEYYRKVINQHRINTGREMYRRHRNELERAAQRFDVPANYIVALWGIETSYGENTGGFNVITALATLAHDGRRADFFRSELMNALKILDAGHINASKMKGSWAGAMGQCQFMPSSFNAYAVDGNGDGRRDIWTTLPDVFASAANYLHSSGWKGDQRWGREVRVPNNLPSSYYEGKTKKSLQAWKEIGVSLPSGGTLPIADMQATLVAPDGQGGRVFLTYDNYNVIKKWNNSTYFATSVGLLADEILR